MGNCKSRVWYVRNRVHQRGLAWLTSNGLLSNGSPLFLNMDCFDKSLYVGISVVKCFISLWESIDSLGTNVPSFRMFSLHYKRLEIHTRKSMFVLEVSVEFDNLNMISWVWWILPLIWSAFLFHFQWDIFQSHTMIDSLDEIFFRLSLLNYSMDKTTLDKLDHMFSLMYSPNERMLIDMNALCGTICSSI